AALAAGNIGDVLVLGRMLSGERLAFGLEWHTAAGAGTFNLGTYELAADGISLGSADSASRWGSGASNAVSAGPLVWPLTAATHADYTTTRDQFICITNVGTAFTTSARFTGRIWVVGD